MLFFKSALKQLKMNLFMNILIVIQLAAVIAILSALVSLIESRLEFYIPFKDEFSSQGYLCNFDLMVYSDTEVKEQIGEATLECSYWDNLAVNEQDLENDPIATTYIYSDRYIEAYTPSMESGEWLNKQTEYSGVLHAVVTPNNPMNLKTGDEFTLTDSLGTSQQAVVIGVVEDNQYTVGASFYNQTDLWNRNNFYDMYYTYNSEVELPYGSWGIYLTEEEYRNSNFYSGSLQIYGMAFVLTDGMSRAESEQIGSILTANYSTLYTKDLSEINSNSFDFIKEQLYILLPIALCIFFLTMITSISVVSISVSSQLKTYAVYYICGAKWSSCSVISFIYSLIICVASGIISIVALLLLKNKTETVISLGLWEWAVMSAAALLYLVFSAVIPLLITHASQPKEILKKE
ncbi:MAG: hypothetical protein LUE12_09345 [Ruminococcus sp.]|nr:hypothetical protein [Ruminococcus sp.]